MRQKHWSVWVIFAVGLSGCKAGGLAPSWSNPFAFLMPKKTSEPEKPSSLANPTPVKPGYSSTDDRALTQSKPGSNPTGQTSTSSLSSKAGYSSLDAAGDSGSRTSALGNRYGGTMAYGSPSSGTKSSSEATSPPYGVPSYGPSGTNPLSSRGGISPQVGRYDGGPGYGENPPLTASRANAVGYPSRDYSSPGYSPDRYGTPSSGSPSSSPNWRSWESVSSGGRDYSPSGTPTRQEGYERIPSWSGSTDRYAPSGYSRGSSSLGDRAAGTTPSTTWNRSGETSPTSSPSGSGPSYVPGSNYRPLDSPSTGAPAPSPYSNPYLTNPSSRDSRFDGANASRNTGRSASDDWARASTRTSPADNPSSGTASSSAWGPPRSGESDPPVGDTGYRPGDTGYRPGETGYNPPNTPPYQMPSGSGTSSGGSSSTGEYRPGSTRTYQSGQSL